MFKSAYILTKNGNEYSDEGIQFLLNIIRNEKQDYSNILLYQGQLYNDPAFFAKELRKNPDSYVFISHAHGIELIGNTNIPILIENLEANPEQSSWYTALEPITKPE